MWVSVQERLPQISTVVKAKRENGEIVTCYFHHDKMSWLNFYCDPAQLSQFQDKDTKVFYNDIVEWWEKD